MIIRFYKEEDVEVDLENIIKYLNKHTKNIVFEQGDKPFSINKEYIKVDDIDKYITLDIRNETKSDLLTILLTNKQYDNNYFYNATDNDKKNILSLYAWEDLTDYSKNTGVVFIMLRMLSQYINNEKSHDDDLSFECIYNFAWNKTEIDTMIYNSIMCDKCQERLSVLNDLEKEKLLEDLLSLLEVVKKSNKNMDIVDYWKSTEKEKVKIFFSYAHKDREFLDEFKEYIKVFERNELVERWDDNELIVGEKWDSTIKEKIYSADIIIFLISSTSLASDYIYNHELKIAFDLKEMEESYVVPIIIKDCLWDMTEFSEFQVLPIEGKAVNSWDKKEEAWTSVSRGLKKAIDSIIRSKSRPLELKSEKSLLKENETISEKQLILSFLEIYSRWWFNVPRIINWGSERDGFETLKKMSKKDLENLLNELVSEQKVKVKRSNKSSNFLYKIFKG